MVNLTQKQLSIQQACALILTLAFYGILQAHANASNLLLALLPLIFFCWHFYLLRQLCFWPLKTVWYLAFFSGLLGFGIQLYFLPYLSFYHWQEFGWAPIAMLIVLAGLLGIYHVIFFLFLRVVKPKILLFYLMIIGYLMFLHQWSGVKCGYPFFYPVLSIAKHFSKPQQLLCVNLQHLTWLQEGSPPVSWVQEQLFDKLSCKKPAIVLAPESFFPHRVEPDVLQLFKDCLGPKQEFWFGARRLDASACEMQTVCRLKYDSVSEFYDKTSLIPYFEERCFVVGKSMQKKLQIGSAAASIFLCYEFFASITALLQTKPKLFFVFIKESWLPKPVLSLMEGYASLVALILQKKVVVISHSQLSIY